VTNLARAKFVIPRRVEGSLTRSRSRCLVCPIQISILRSLAALVMTTRIEYGLQVLDETVVEALAASNAITTLRSTLDVRRFLILHSARLLALLDKLPELTRLAELRVFRNGQFAAEKEIAKRVLV
jgi:hypothetical protein